MSEYQYYEFQAIDRPLDAAAQRALRDISSRAQITSSSFTNAYNWGNLRGDPEQMLLRWFDAMLYVANWGTRWLAFRLPRHAIRSEEIAPYVGEATTFRQDEDYIVVNLRLDEEEGYYEPEPDGVLSQLLLVRGALLSGDTRCLYLGWLLDVQWGVVEEDDKEPPVPPGLGALDGAHRALVEFLRIDVDLIAAAAEASAALSARGADEGATRAWLAAQSDVDKDTWLLRVLDGDGGAAFDRTAASPSRRDRWAGLCRGSAANGRGAAAARRGARSGPAKARGRRAGTAAPTGSRAQSRRA